MDTSFASEACGVAHPGLITTDDLDILDGLESRTPLREVYGYEPGWGLPSPADQAAIIALMTGAPQGESAPLSATSR